MTTDKKYPLVELPLDEAEQTLPFTELEQILGVKIASPQKCLSRLTHWQRKVETEYGVPYHLLQNGALPDINRLKAALQHFETRLEACVLDGRKHFPVMPLLRQDFLGEWKTLRVPKRPFYFLGLVQVETQVDVDSLDGLEEEWLLLRQNLPPLSQLSSPVFQWLVNYLHLCQLTPFLEIFSAYAYPDYVTVSEARGIYHSERSFLQSICPAVEWHEFVLCVEIPDLT